MPTFRKLLFWGHLVAGCFAGLVILLMSLTGVILTYERQILSWVERGEFSVSPGTTRLPVEQLLAAAASQRKIPGDATLTLRADPREAAEINVGRARTLYIDPHTGLALGSSTSGLRSFFQQITAWHRWLGMEGAGRATARAITGACNFAFLFLVMSGAYLWLPKVWSRQHLRPITWFRGGLSGKARDFNWHTVFGIWAAVPLFAVVLTALPMSYGWANDLLYVATGNRVPAPPVRTGGNNAPGRADFTGLNVLWQKAEAQIPDWQSISLRLAEGGEVSFNIDSGNGGQPQKRATLTLRRATGEIVRWEPFASQNLGRRLRSWSRFLHTGEALGWVGQTLAGLGSAAGVMLVWTGLSLALRRWLAWRTRKATSRVPSLGDAMPILPQHNAGSAVNTRPWQVEAGLDRSSARELSEKGAKAG